MLLPENSAPHNPSRKPVISTDNRASGVDVWPDKIVLLPNALQLVLHDESRRYFGDYFKVRIVATVAIPLESSGCPADPDRENVRQILPSGARYRKVIEKMGVPSTEVAAVRDGIIDDFLRHAGGYLGSADFPRQFIHSELVKSRIIKPKIVFMPTTSGA